jgi:asparaginyl-tRNA synthetase
VPELIQIQDIARCEGQEVTVKGWLYNRTDKGKLQFLLVRDGTGIAQCVAFKKDLDEATFAQAAALTQESSLCLTGTVRKDDRAPGIPGGYEVGIQALEVIQQADEYPIALKEHGVEFLMENRHLWICPASSGRRCASAPL